MGIAIDIILIAIFAYNIISCARNGMVRSFMSIITLFCSTVAAWLFYPTLALVYKNLFLDRISSDIGDSINAIISGGAGAIDLSSLFADRPEAFTGIFDRYNVGIAGIEDAYYSLVGKSTEDIIPNISKLIARPVTDALSNLLAFLTIFVGVLIVLKVVAWILDMIFSLPVLNALNHVGGFVIGLICGAGMTYIVALLITAAIPVLAALFPNKVSASSAESSVLLGLLDKINFEDIEISAKQLISDLSL